MPFISAPKLANLTGKVMSIKWVVEDITQMKTQHLYRVIESHDTWEKTISLNQHYKAISEIWYWRNNFNSLNIRKPTVTIASDAYFSGLGGHTQVGSKEFIVHKTFSPEKSGTGSTHREVYANLFALSTQLTHSITFPVRFSEKSTERLC